MYTPKVNAENSVEVLHAFMRPHPLCALATQTEDGLMASHIPMVLHVDGDGATTLRGHLARANTQWKDCVQSQDVLGIFSGPEHYISASWYPDKATHGKEVPTWNYVAIHVYGRLRMVEDSAWLLEHLRALTDTNEVIVDQPWKVDDAPADFVQKLTRGIVGLEIEVSRYEGEVEGKPEQE